MREDLLTSAGASAHASPTTRSPTTIRIVGVAQRLGANYNVAVVHVARRLRLLRRKPSRYWRPRRARRLACVHPPADAHLLQTFDGRGSADDRLEPAGHPPIDASNWTDPKWAEQVPAAGCLAGPEADLAQSLALAATDLALLRSRSLARLDFVTSRLPLWTRAVRPPEPGDYPLPPANPDTAMG